VVVAEAVAAGMSASLAWELFEYATFLTRSTEWISAYSDTVGDLALGWVGAALAGVSIAAARSVDRQPPDDGPMTARWSPDGRRMVAGWSPDDRRVSRGRGAAG
jgi:hypothetical protein